MKRSKNVSLILMAGGASASLTACGDGAVDTPPPAPSFPSVAECVATDVFTANACEGFVGQTGPAEAKTYTTVDNCIADDYFTDTYCTAKYDEALELHSEHAPAYTDVNACEETHGAQACRPQQVQGQQGSFWTPFLAGYLVSNAFNSFSRPYPYYQDRAGGYTTYGGTNIGRAAPGRSVRMGETAYRANQSAATAPNNQAKAKSGQLRSKPQRTTVAKRSGFGGRSGGYGG